MHKRSSNQDILASSPFKKIINSAGGEDEKHSGSRIMPSFTSLGNTDIAQFLRSTGKMITSLQIVGTFLSHVGY